MAPMSTKQKSRRILASTRPFSANHDGRPEPFAKFRRRPHLISNRDSLRFRQTLLNSKSGTPADSNLTPPGSAPTAALHASVIPQSVTTQIIDGPPATNTYTSHKQAQTTEIALIVAGVVFAILLGLGLIVIQARKPNFFPVCFRRCRRTPKLKKVMSISSSSKKGILITDDYDDLTWGTPTRIIHFESAFDDKHHDRGPVEPILHQHRDLLSNFASLESAPTPVPIFGHRVIESPPHLREETFQRRLHIEEEDIASALTVALRDILASGTSSRELSGNAITNVETRREHQNLSPLVGTDRAAAISSFESLRDGLNGIGKHASIFGFKSRPRQGSDASATSQETTETHTLERFSSADSKSSMTSIANSEVDYSDTDGHESTYELKRAQTQSLEIKKGVLIAWQCTSANSANIEMPSKVIVSEPHQMDPNVVVGTAHTSRESLSHAGELATTQTVSSLVREISLGTLPSLTSSFSSSTRAEGWCTDEGGFLQPPVPYLMVTRPSTSSIFTTDSTGSSVSVDLNDFPHPPSPVQPTYFQLTDQISGQKRVWDNHPLDSTMAQKRSTVERFIMMYETD